MPQPTRANGNGGGWLSIYKDRPQMVGDAFNHLKGIHDNLTVHTQLLESLVERSYVETEADVFKWLRSGSLTANATGEADTSGVTALENRTGYEMELVSWASACNNAAASGGILFYLGSIDNNNLIWAESITQYASDKFQSGMMVPVNGILVAQFLGMGNGTLCNVNVLVRRAQHRQAGQFEAEPTRGW